MSSDSEIQALRDEIRQLRGEVDRLSAIEAVKRVKHKYWRSFDTADLEGMASCLHEDVKLSIEAGIYSMCYEGRDAYVQMVKEGAHADMISHHNGHHPEIDIVSDDEAIGTWYLYDDLWEFRRGMRLFGTAFYRDRYVRCEDGEWRIRYSQFHRLYEIKVPLTERPDIQYHYLATHGYKHPGDAPLEPFPKDTGYKHPPGEMPPFLDTK